MQTYASNTQGEQMPKALKERAYVAFVCLLIQYTLPLLLPEQAFNLPCLLKPAPNHNLCYCVCVKSSLMGPIKKEEFQT